MEDGRWKMEDGKINWSRYLPAVIMKTYQLPTTYYLLPTIYYLLSQLLATCG
jgi:hypothetical protein